MSQKQKYAPSVFEKYVTTVSVGGKEIKLNLYDTAGKILRHMPPPLWNVLSTSLEHHSSTIETEMDKQYRHSFTGFCFFMGDLALMDTEEVIRDEDVRTPSDLHPEGLT